MQQIGNIHVKERYSENLIDLTFRLQNNFVILDELINLPCAQIKSSKMKV